jgi:hypothetical protein
VEKKKTPRGKKGEEGNVFGKKRNRLLFFVPLEVLDFSVTVLVSSHGTGFWCNSMFFVGFPTNILQNIRVR